MRRRSFLLMGLGVAGGLVVGWSLVPPRQRLRAKHAADLPDGTVQLNGWLAIAPDGTVTVISPKAEMGQGIHTALAMLVAEELEVPLASVQVVHAPIDTIYGNIAALADGLPLHPDQATSALGRTLHWFTAKTAREIGVLMTGGSSSVRDVWAIAREAGATARVALVAAAAARFGVPPDQCRAEQGRVIFGDRSIGYGEILEEAAAQHPVKVALKDPATFTLIGRDVPRLDSRAKSVGAPLFGIDLELPGMLQAAVAMPPAFGSRPTTFDREAALALPGVKAIVPLEGSTHGDPPGVAVVAETWWQAKQALAALTIEWSPSPHAALDSAAIQRTLREVAETNDGFPFRTTLRPRCRRARARLRSRAGHAPSVALGRRLRSPTRGRLCGAGRGGREGDPRHPGAGDLVARGRPPLRPVSPRCRLPTRRGARRAGPHRRSHRALRRPIRLPRTQQARGDRDHLLRS